MFGQWVPRFHFALGPVDYIAVLSPRGGLIRKCGGHAHGTRCLPELLWTQDIAEHLIC